MAFKTSYKKYGNSKTEYDGRKYDSKFEAGVARDLDLMLKAGEIKDWDAQFKVECIPYTEAGDPVHTGMKKLLVTEGQIPIPLDFVRFYTHDEYLSPGNDYQIIFIGGGTELTWVWLNDKKARDECYQNLLEKFGEPV